MSSLRRLRYKLARMADDFALFTTDVIYDRRHGRAAEVLASFLYGLSFIFNALVRLRLYLYEHRILRSKPLGCLVVVVGNLDRNLCHVVRRQLAPQILPKYFNNPEDPSLMNVFT